MNTERPSPPGTEHYRSLQILDELSNNDSLTQRDLSGRLGIALGLVNSYIKNLVKKGYITVKTIPTKRFAYYLTPKGFTEKTRLTYDLLHDYTRIYREARRCLKMNFQELEKNGNNKIVFAGADEIAEIAYITLQETNIELVGVVNLGNVDALFFGKQVKPLSRLKDMQYDCIIVASYVNRDKIRHALLQQGADKKTIRDIF